MNNFNVCILSSIFQHLGINDLVNCSRVSKKWNKAFKVTKPKYLFIRYGRKKVLKKNCTHKSVTPYVSSDLVPNYTIKNNFLKFSRIDLFKNIEIFIFHGNENLHIPKSFNFYKFSKLKYIEIKDFSFCDVIFKNYFKNLHEEDDPWKYFNSSLETLILEHTDLSAFLTLTNLKHFSVRKLFNNECFMTIKEPPMTKLKSFSWKNDILNFIGPSKRCVLDYLLNSCPSLEAIDIKIGSDKSLDEILSKPNLINICVKICHKKRDKIPFDGYKAVISKHEKRLKKECCLCINNVLIKSLDDFVQLMKNSSSYTKKRKSDQVD